MLGHTHPFHNIPYSLAWTARRPIAPPKKNDTLRAKKQELLRDRDVCSSHLRQQSRCSLFTLVLPPCAGNTLLIHPGLGWYCSDSSEEILLLVVACHSEKAQQERQKTMQNSKMNEEEEKQVMTGWGGKIATCSLTRQKNREKKTEQPNDTPVTTKNQVGELKESKYWLWRVAW